MLTIAPRPRPSPAARWRASPRSRTSCTGTRHARSPPACGRTSSSGTRAEGTGLVLDRGGVDGAVEPAEPVDRGSDEAADRRRDRRRRRWPGTPPVPPASPTRRCGLAVPRPRRRRPSPPRHRPRRRRARSPGPCRRPTPVTSATSPAKSAVIVPMSTTRPPIIARRNSMETLVIERRRQLLASSVGDVACQTGGVLLGIDEYPFHQVTDTFAAVAGSDPSWNDGHYVCAADQAGTSWPSRRTSGCTPTTTSSTASSASVTATGSTTCASRAGSAPTWNGSAPGRCGSRSSSRSQTVRLVLDDNAVGITLDVTCHSANVPYMGPIEVRRARRPADVGAGHLRDHRRGGGVGGGRLASASCSNAEPARSSATIRGGTSRRGVARSPTARPSPSKRGTRGAPVGAVPYAATTVGSSSRIRAGATAAGRGAILARRSHRAGRRRRHRSRVLRRRPPAPPRDSSA